MKILVRIPLVFSLACAPTSVPSWCDVHPDHCYPCDPAIECPGSGPETEWVCCSPGEGCVAVVLASECEGEIVGSCEWGESIVDDAGLPDVVCHDPR